jgi:transcriptional regulator with XRE-family HTH domain
MSGSELALLKQLKISHQTVAKALGKRRQTVTRGLGLSTTYLTVEKLKKIANYLENGEQSADAAAPANPELAKRFRDEAKGLSEAGQTAFDPQETRVVRDRRFLERDIIDDGEVDEPGPFPHATELWIFRSRPQETEHPRNLEWMRRWYYDPPAGHSPTPRRLVYFSSPDRARRLGRYLLEVFGSLQNRDDRIHVIVIESRALSIVPDYVIVNPLENNPEAWAAGQDDYGNTGWIRLSQTNVELILDNLRGAGIAGFENKFFVETFNDDLDESRSIPRFTLRFDSRDLVRSRQQLALASSAT